MTPEQTAAALERERQRIDEVDRRIVGLLNERANIVASIGDIKQSGGLRVYEPKREDEVYQNIQSVNGGPLQGAALKRIYERIIDEMRTLQRDRMAARTRTDPGAGSRSR